MNKEQIDKIKPKSMKKTPLAIRHDSPIIIQLPKYNVFLAIKTNIAYAEVGLDEYGEVIMNKIPNKDGEFEPMFYGINAKPSITLLTKDELKDYLSIYQHD